MDNPLATLTVQFLKERCGPQKVRPKNLGRIRNTADAVPKTVRTARPRNDDQFGRPSPA